MHRVLCSMLLSVLLLSFSACAFADNTSTVLKYLSCEDEELFQKKMYFENIDIESENNKIKVLIDDAVWEDDELHVGMKFVVEEPVYAIVDEITINEVLHDSSNSSFDGQWLEPASNQESFGISIPIQMPEDHRFDISISISFLSPKDSNQYICIGEEDNAGIWKAIDEAFQRGKTPLDQDEPHSVFVSSAYFGSDFENTMEVSFPLNSSEALVEYSNMTIASIAKKEFSVSW